MLLYTIGVYGWSPDAFLGALTEVEARLVVDVRQRRGVRGSEYAWANAVRLQAALGSARIAYEHWRQLAPTTELRELQYAEDAREGVGKRSRVALAPAYVERYTAEILDRADLEALVRRLPTRGSSALLCVERDPAACHRSLVADRLAARFEVDVEHLLPQPES